MTLPRVPLLTLLGCLSLSLAHVSFAHAERVIIADQEQHVLALFAPAGLGDEVVPGHRLMDVAIQAREVVVTLVAADASLVLRLTARGEPFADGTRVLETESFQLLSAEPLDATALQTARALGERVRANDDGGFWAEVTAEVSGSADASDQPAWWPLARLALVAGLLATLVGLVVRRARLKRREAKTDADTQDTQDAQDAEDTQDAQP